MEPFVYDDYSDFDTEELDLEPPRRRLNTRFSPRRSLRSVSPFEVNVDEDAMEKIRNRARQATSDFLDSCDAIRQKAKAKDEDALRKFDAAIKIPMSTPQKDSNSSVRRGSLGLPPIMPRANQEGSIVSDTVITDELPARRSSLKGHPFNITPKEGSASPESEKDLSGMPPRVPRQGSILRDSHRSPHLPPMAPAPPVPPNVSTTPIVMNEISALEAFARDTRVRAEKHICHLHLSSNI
ncbi:unnamed protein product [Hymenolepis diminuta]|uniref:Uncharacterized protein n=1 Tax=Hymenolepis diminuta TaxID=6216 RepID=A0A564YEX6_HYMDI|nr:unnamed protein product [Hymenolepis diminuta]